MSAAPLVGQWVWGEAKTPCQIIAIGTKRSSGQTVLEVAHPQGQSIVIPLSRVKGFSDTPPVWNLPPTNPYPTGTIVHKRHNLGWMGIILQTVDPDSVEVLWWLDQYPTLMAANDLRLVDKAVAESSLKAFAQKGGG
jgi:hypothetical protein